jgi:hypothetical protein
MRSSIPSNARRPLNERGDVMPGKVRAKFSVQQVFQAKTTDGSIYSENVTLSPVYSPDPNTENAAFWKATPSGRIDLYISNPDAFGRFEQGAEYYVDFTPAKAGVASNGSGS